MKRNPDEALLKNVTATNLHFNGALREVRPLNPGDAIPFAPVQVHGLGPVGRLRDLTIDDAQLPGGQPLGEIDSSRAVPVWYQKRARQSARACVRDACLLLEGTW